MSWKMLEKIEYHIDQKVRLQKKNRRLKTEQKKHVLLQNHIVFFLI